MNKRKTKDQAVIRPVQKEAISEIRCEEDFVEFLRRELEWPIPYNIQKLSDVSIPHDLQRDFGFNPVEDRIAVSRLLNLAVDQPWGVFLFEFKTQRPYLSHLRKILRVLGSQKTLMKGDPIWDREDLLFVCTSDWSQFQFAHFSGKKAESAVISTFGWKGPEDPFLHTLCKHNLPRLRMPSPETDGVYNTDKWRDTWKEAFNIKPVTDEFYATLKEVFDAVQAGITGLDGEERRFFAELVVNRLIFLKFVEKKGWLDDDRDYLYNKFRAYGKSDFWGDFLCYLFFKGLCQEPVNRSQQANEILGKVPFLNAELFSPSEKWNDWDIRVNNRAFDLLFDKLLNPYNFTVCETSPLDIEVAFNQDLLGYGYEELIADQHGQGAYYTHPTEVNLMCRQSLWAYLENRCPEVSKDSIGRLLYSELDEEHSISLEHALILYKALHEVTVVDPALGSGTFPVAMMKHLFLAQTTLGAILSGYPEYESMISEGSLTDHRNAFVLKLHIIERSIYGCDIDYFAVQIAKLRFWIELMVNCDQPEALPNFDCKLVVGDALVSVVGTDSQGKLITLEDHLGHPTKSSGQGDILHSIGKLAIEELGLLKHEYFNAKSVDIRQTLERQVKEKHQELLLSVGIDLEKISITDKHVLWQITYAEVFSGTNPGFDIAIANPPYLRQELIDNAYHDSDCLMDKKTLALIYKRTYDTDVSGKADLYVYFFTRSISLCNTSGVICFICSNSWLDVDFGTNLKEYVIANTKIEAIIDSSAKRSFDNADINTIISVFVKIEVMRDIDVFRFISFKIPYDHIRFDDILVSSKQQCSSVEDDIEVSIYRRKIVDNERHSVLLPQTSQPEIKPYEKWGTYLRAPRIFQQIIDIVNPQLVELGEISEIRRGITTGISNYFLIDRSVVNQFNIESQYLRPILVSLKEVSGYRINVNDLKKFAFVCNDSISDLVTNNKTGALNYIEWGVGKGFNNISTVKSRKQWYTLPEQNVYDFVSNRFIGERYGFPAIDNTLVSDVFFAGRFHGNNKEINLALLNSTLSYFLAEANTRKTYGIGVAYLYGPEIRGLKILNPKDLNKYEKERIISKYEIIQRRALLTVSQEVKQQDRIDFDIEIFKTFGLDISLLNKMYDSLVQMIDTRLKKGKSSKKM